MTQQIRCPLPAGRPPLAPRATALLAFATFAALAALATAPRTAVAQPRSAEAEQLFLDGKQLIKDGKLAEACLAFEASQKLEGNLATLLSLADCQERIQHYASAWAYFLAAERETRDARARNPKDAINNRYNKTASERAAALKDRLSFLTINVPDDSRVEGLQVMRDGVEVDALQWNRAAPVDGGAHVITGKAPGHEPWSTTVQVAAERDQRAVEVPKFKELPTLVSPQLGLTSLRARSIDGETSADGSAPSPSPFTPRRKIALGVAAGSVVIAGVAVGFGLAANNARDEALALCPATACTPAGAAAAQDENDTARRHALTANLGYAVAGGAAIGAAVLWFTSGPERAQPATTSASAASASSRAASPSLSARRTLSLSPLLGAANGVALTGGF